MFRKLLILCFSLAFSVMNVRAQEFRATLGGVITDSQGAVVPGVQVTLVQVDTKAEFTTVSGPTGRYSLPLLPPAVYTLTAKASGFETYIGKGLELSVNQHATVDIVLKVGASADFVTVSAIAPLLDEASATIGQPISSALANDLPLTGRAAMALSRLAVGVQGGSYTLARPFDSGSSVGFTMGGAQSGDNELLLDGGTDMAPNANGAGRRSTYQPPVESVLETKVESFQSDASYGDSGGGTVNVITKSGTNNLHGTMSWFNQNSALAATPFFTNSSGGKKNTILYNQWAATVGGPVIIPKIVNGRNRVFWYTAYEGIKHTVPQPTTLTVPTLAERMGDFSALLKLGGNYQIYDPKTAVAVGVRRQRMPFVGNIIPAERISPIAKNYLSFYPAPNQPGLPDGENNYYTPMKRHDDYFSLLSRFDFVVSPSTSFWWRYYNAHRTEYIRNRFDNIASGERRPRNVEGMIADVVHTFNPTTVLDTRLNWTRMWDAEYRQSDAYDFSQLGFPASLVAASQHVVMPVITFSDSTFGIGGNGANPGAGFVDTFDDYQSFTTLNKNYRSHNFKIGVDLRRVQFDLLNNLYSSGLYNFGTNWTNGPLDNSPSAPIGQSLAAFLLGLPTSGEFDRTAAQTNSAWYIGTFFQDDWRISKTLTLNLGLRYEKETPTTERYNRTTNGFDPTSPNGISAAAEAAYAANPIPILPAANFKPVGGPLFATPQNPKVYRTGNKNFSPRIGFAWAPAVFGGRTVIRGGFGSFYSTIGTDGIQQTGFNAITQMVVTNDGYLTPAATLANPFPVGVQLNGTGAANGLNTFLGNSITFTNPYIQNPRTDRWVFTIQHQLSNNLLFEIGYIGSRGVNLRENENASYVPAQYLSTSPTRDQATINTLTANVPNPFQGLLPGTTLNGSTITTSQLLMTYPQLTGLTEYSANNGYSLFNMLQVRMEERFSNGLQFLTSFQLARQMDALSRLNPTDKSLSRRVSTLDHPLKALITGSYELPFGKGRHFLSQAGRLVDGIAGGWKAAGTYTYEVGAPLTWGNLIYYGGDLNYNPRNINAAFNTAAFNTVSSQQLLFNIRTFPLTFSNLRADSLNNLDAAVLKDFALWKENIKMQLRFEAFNATNHAQFSAPSLTPTSSTFGKVTAQANDPRTFQTGVRVVW